MSAGNLLMRDGDLCAVIDFGNLGTDRILSTA